MPIYEYECARCGHVFEKIQRFSDPAVRSCPECRGRVKKLVSQSAFVLRGGGWYADGYSGSQSKAKKGKKGESPASSDAGGKKTSSGKAAKDKS